MRIAFRMGVVVISAAVLQYGLVSQLPIFGVQGDILANIACNIRRTLFLRQAALALGRMRLRPRRPAQNGGDNGQNQCRRDHQNRPNPTIPPGSKLQIALLEPSRFVFGELAIRGH